MRGPEVALAPLLHGSTLKFQPACGGKSISFFFFIFQERA